MWAGSIVQAGTLERLVSITLRGTLATVGSIIRVGTLQCLGFEIAPVAWYSAFHSAH